ncbi:PAS domain S-box-containing protein [Acidovorax sp. 69]|uniref:sensor histidine kinase n=1 Tax=Acidovorax sp. 69 TaxID=2035202 RepID=UPI000C244B30|nr:PAS domain-containing sensor histidine kinase [Acidovorax sp. 69]PJI97473.1 PAS domain S-box-containing protein [Acidovorax sp. 69]
MPSPVPFLGNMRQFQVRLLKSFLLANTGFGLLLCVVGFTGTISTPESWSTIIAMGSLVMGALWLALCRWPRTYALIAAVQTLLGLALFTYALWQPMGHELRAVWFVIGVGATYLLLGRVAGICYTVVVLALMIGSSNMQRVPYSHHALIAFTLALSLCSFGFYLFVGHALKLYQHLSDREQQFTLLTEGAEEVIWRINPDMTVAYVSPSDERVRGIAAHEVIGRPIYEALAPQGPATLDQAVSNHQALLTLPMRCKNGKVRWFEMSSRLYRDTLGNPAGYHCIGRDVTERRDLEQALQAERQHLEARVRERTAALSIAKETAEAALRTKSIFLANIGHELRTPMTLILGMTEIAHQRVQEERMKPVLHNVMDAAKGLMRLLNDLMDLAALESRQVAFKFAPLSMPEVAANALQLLQPQARQKGLQLALLPPGMGSDAVHIGDADRIQQVLIHLLDNAVKFSNTGSIRLAIEVEQDTVEATVWRLQVIDQGIGIAAADQHRIFTLFEQVDGSSTRSFEGAGLGLALSKRLVEGMGGRLGLQSAPGEGSCFWVTLPLPKVA